MTVSASHERKIHGTVSLQSEQIDGFGKGVRVRLEGLSHVPVTYGSESWTNPSVFNGSTGTIVRREQGHWIVKLDQNRMVIFKFTQIFRFPCRNLCAFLLPPAQPHPTDCIASSSVPPHVFPSLALLAIMSASPPSQSLGPSVMPCRPVAHRASSAPRRRAGIPGRSPQPPPATPRRHRYRPAPKTPPRPPRAGPPRGRPAAAGKGAELPGGPGPRLAAGAAAGAAGAAAQARLLELRVEGAAAARARGAWRGVWVCVVRACVRACARARARACLSARARMNFEKAEEGGHLQPTAKNRP